MRLFLLFVVTSHRDLLVSRIIQINLQRRLVREELDEFMHLGNIPSLVKIVILNVVLEVSGQHVLLFLIELIPLTELLDNRWDLVSRVHFDPAFVARPQINLRFENDFVFLERFLVKRLFILELVIFLHT